MVPSNPEAEARESIDRLLKSADRYVELNVGPPAAMPASARRSHTLHVLTM